MISLIIATKDRAYLLEKVLDGFYNLELISEVIFVDDASDDNTGELIKKYSEKYPLIKTQYLRNKSRKGAPFSKRLGAMSATSEYLLFCDDDEKIEPDYAKKCMDLLKHRL